MEPAIFFILLALIIGVVITLFIFIRSKERQMMIERGIAPEEMVKIYQRAKHEPRDHHILLKLGVIGVVFGIFLGMGFFTSHIFHDSEEFLGAFVVIGVGVAFISAHYAGIYEVKRKKLNDPE